MASTSAHIAQNRQQTRLRKRGVREESKDADISDTEPVEALIQKTSTLSLQETPPASRRAAVWKHVVAPVGLTALAAFVRLYGIGDNQTVVWDEAHFGKFGSHYIQHEFYFDVHPPLGKLLVGLSGYLAGFDGSFKFDVGLHYPPGPQFTAMRVFNSVFGILCTPVAYFTALELQMSAWTAWLVGASVALEMLALILSRFILLDSMLLFFTAATFLCLAKVHTLSSTQKLISACGALWTLLLGLFIGCVCSVKLVGLFVTTLVGLYTIYDLAVKFYQTQIADKKHRRLRISYAKYVLHWALRVVGLMVVPFTVYVLSFVVHFKVLSRSGPGDGSISTLFQATLDGNSLKFGPRSVAYGSMVTIRSQGLSPNLLHSHGHVYPDGSQQQQVTTYGYKDMNNDFLVEFDLETSQEQHRFATLEYDPDAPENILDYTTLLKDGDILRLQHRETGCFLHSHSIAAAMLPSQYEVSCYGGHHIDDAKDEWVIEILNQYQSPVAEFRDEDPNEIHPASTNFRLRHQFLGCYLATTGVSYPAWGFQQGEVVCKRALFALDKSTWWNIEDHTNDRLPAPNTTYVPPRPMFWKEFILLNYGMLASNNALVPDVDHHDPIASSWWEWPILRSGLRMGVWSSTMFRYFLMGHVFITYLSTAALPVAVVTLVVTLLCGQRQTVDLSVAGENWNFHLSAGVLPVLGWVLHYLPFVIMARVTYLHHYAPAQYFGIFVYAYLFEYYFARNSPRTVKYVMFALAYLGVFGGFWYFHPFALGMTGSFDKYAHLKLFETWNL